MGRSSSVNPLWPALGLVAGYAVFMVTNPVGASLRDGFRVVKRYPALWLAFGMFGFGYAAFDLGVRVYTAYALPPDQAPLFLWARSAYRPEWSWVTGLRDSLWQLPAHGLSRAAHEALFNSVDRTAELFNNYLSTFPLSAVAALGLLLNVGRRGAVMFHALRKRYRAWGVCIHVFVLLCAVAALLKPFALALPGYIDPDLWYQWSPVLTWFAFLFEYLFGVYVQVYLILLAYCWVRGLNFDNQHLRDFALRRTAFVFRWAVVVMILSTALIDVPLILKNFQAFSQWFPNEPSIVEGRVKAAQLIIDATLLAFASTQIVLTFHGESLPRAWRDHFTLLARKPWSFICFLLSAGLHLFLIEWTSAIVQAAVGEGTALWVAWKLIYPWVAGLAGAWLLASWVCVYQRFQGRGAPSEEWVRF